MPAFRYMAVDAQGDTQRGQLEAADRVGAMQQLSGRGLTPIEVSQGRAAADIRWWQRDVSLSGSSIPNRHLIAFLQNFATLAEAKLPLKQVLAFTREQCGSAQLKHVLQNVEEDVANGQPLAASMAKHGNIFPKRFVTMLEIGERSNTLEQAARNAADMIETEDKLRSEVRSALIYPVILMVMAAAVMGLLLFHLAPTLAPVFATAGAEPPWTIVQMLRVRSALINYWPLFLVLIALPFLALKLFRGPARSVMEPVLLKLPWIGSYYRNRETHKIAQSLSLMLASGATMSEALATAEQASEWKLYRDLMDETRQAVEAGGKLSQTLGASQIIAPILRTMISAGEESDRLQQILVTATRTLSRDSAGSLQLAVRLLTPVLTLVIGLIVGSMIFSTITAVLDLNDLAV